MLHPVRACILDVGRKSLLNSRSLNIRDENSGLIDGAYILFETLGEDFSTLLRYSLMCYLFLHGELAIGASSAVEKEVLK
jgi:hypothetical protein